MEEKMERKGSIRRRAKMGGRLWLPMKLFFSLKDDGVSKTFRKGWALWAGKDAQEKMYVRRLYSQRTAQLPADDPALKIRFSVLVPLYNTDTAMLKEMLDSVRNQTFENWELCLADGSDDAHGGVGETCEQYARQDPRIRYRKLKENRGISANTNACLEMATGDYLVLLDHDDLLLPNALQENAVRIRETGADFLYSDELIFASPNKTDVISIHFKPDFAPDNLLSSNYICHLTVFSAALLRETEAFRSRYDGSQDHDLVLRLTDRAKRIVHIPEVLYLWRSHELSVAGDLGSKSYAVEAGRNAVKDFLASAGVEVQVESSPVYASMYRVKYPVPENAVVSVIVSGFRTRQEAADGCAALRSRTDYPSAEWIVTVPEEEAGEESGTQDGVRIISCRNPSPAAVRNRGAREARGDYLLFVDADLLPDSPDWIQEMLMFAAREKTGAVGGRLIFTDGTIRHAGIILGLGRRRTAARSHFRTRETESGHCGVTIVAGDVSAVTAECMMVRKELFASVGGFEEEMGGALYDIDFCLKLRKRGLLVVYTPYAQLRGGTATDYLAELGREREDYDEMRNRFLARWQETIEKGDPYYNPNFSLDTFDFRPAVM